MARAPRKQNRSSRSPKKAVKKRRAVRKKAAVKKTVPARKRTKALKPKAPSRLKQARPSEEKILRRSVPVPETEPLFLKSTVEMAPLPAQRIPELPQHYGDNLIHLMVRDPHWMFAYWEIQKDHQEKALASLQASWSDVKWILRLYDTTGSREAPVYMDIPLAAYAERWYFHVQPGHSYFVEVGLLHHDGRYVALARSNEVQAPRASISEITDEKWAGGQASDEIFALSGGLSIGNGKSSMDMRRRLEEQLLSGISSGSGSAWLSSITSPGGGSLAGIPAERGRKFWFVLDCEVIIYGATEPDAKFTFQGRPVKLRPDGTFSFRFALPDGDFRFEAKAESADGVEERTITPVVQRRTERPAPVFKDGQGQKK